jgi:hypothetical protein
MRNNKDSTKEDEQLISSSPTLVTKYAHQSSKLIHSIEKNLYVIIAVVAALAVVSVVDALEVIGITNLIGDGLDDVVIAILSLASLAAILPMLRLSLESKKTLEEWADMFEYNSIKNSISMSLTTATGEELVYAIAEAVEEIECPLHEYIEKGDFSEFINVKIGEDSFDVLIDSETTREEKGANLKRILSEYGAIIIKIVEGTISKKEIESFSSEISRYASSRHKKIKTTVALAMLVGREVSSDAYATTRSGDLQMKHMLLIEKP